MDFRPKTRYEQGIAFHDYTLEPLAPPLQVLSAGAAVWGEGWSFSRLHSEIFGVELVLRGQCELVQAGRRHEVHAGQVYLLHLGVGHHYRAIGSVPLLKRFLTFGGPLLEPMLRHSGLKDASVITLSEPSRMSHLMKETLRLLRSKPPGFAARLSSLGYDILLELGGRHAPSLPGPIRASMDHLQQNLERPLHVVELQRISGLSMTHFNRLFREHLGLSPARYLQEQRMALARHLLSQTGLGIQEVARSAGFDDPLHFSRQFRRRHGMAPREYRGRMRGDG